MGADTTHAQITAVIFAAVVGGGRLVVDLPAWIEVLAAALALVAILGALAAAWRQSYSRGLIEAQAREIDLLGRKVARLEGELTRAEADRDKARALAQADRDAAEAKIESLSREIDTLSRALSGRADIERLVALVTQHDADVRTGRDQLREEFRVAVDRIHRDLLVVARTLGARDDN